MECSRTGSHPVPPYLLQSFLDWSPDALVFISMSSILRMIQGLMEYRFLSLGRLLAVLLDLGKVDMQEILFKTRTSSFWQLHKICVGRCEFKWRA